MSIDVLKEWLTKSNLLTTYCFASEVAYRVIPDGLCDIRTTFIELLVAQDGANDNFFFHMPKYTVGKVSRINYNILIA